jgi:hypothetical protein
LASGVAVGFHSSRFGPSSGALSLSTVCSAIGLAGLLHPAAMFRTPTVQGLLSPCSSALSSTAPCPRAFRSVRAPRLPGCHTLEPWLRGLFPHEAALHQQSGEAPPVPAPLFGFVLLQVLRLSLAVPFSSVRSAPDVSRSRDRVRSARIRRLQRLHQREPDSLTSKSLLPESPPPDRRPARASQPTDSTLSRAFLR